MSAKSLPAGHHTAGPYLIVRNAASALDFYNKAFGAAELMRLTGPHGKIVHAEVQVGDSPIMIAEENPEWGNHTPQSSAGSSGHIHLFVDDVDQVAQRAVAACAKLLVPVRDQFYGDRSGRVIDPFGHIWRMFRSRRCIGV